MKNIFKTSEFANAGATLARAVLGGQPNAMDSAAMHNAQRTELYAQGLAKQEAIKKAKEDEKKAKKKRAFGSIGSILGTLGAAAIPGLGPLAAVAAAGAGSTIGGMAGERLAGGGGSSFGDAAMQYGAPAALSAAPGAGKAMMENAKGPQFDGTGPLAASTIAKPKRYKLGQALSSLSDRYELQPNQDGTFTYFPASAFTR